MEPIATVTATTDVSKLKPRTKSSSRSKMLSPACYIIYSISLLFSPLNIISSIQYTLVFPFQCVFPLCALLCVATLHVYQQVVSMNNVIYIFSFAGSMRLPLPTLLCRGLISVGIFSFFPLTWRVGRCIQKDFQRAAGYILCKSRYYV